MGILPAMAAEQKATSLNLSLPASMKAFIEAEVERGHYGSTSEFIRHLVREAQKSAREQEKLEALLIEGLDSGPGEEPTPEYWRQIHAEIDDLIAKRRPTRKRSG